uniref:Tudor domain-containing protein n=1 Tax=Ornithorhynchus anatinus TaxID=9258 RepID=A0A6I8NWE6_ORNAN
ILATSGLYVAISVTVAFIECLLCAEHWTKHLGEFDGVVSQLYLLSTYSVQSTALNAWESTIEKQRPRKVKGLCQGQTAGRWWSRELNPDPLHPRPGLFPPGPASFCLIMQSQFILLCSVNRELSSPPAQELVIVSYVVHPCHFYVRKYSLRKIAAKMEKNLNRFCSMNQYPSPSEVLELGARVFVNSKENGVWCRATVTGLIPLEGKHVEQSHGPKKYSIGEIAVLQVYMIDFGNTEVFIIPGYAVVDALCLVIRKPDNCKKQLRVRNPLALRCTLKDLVPPYPNEHWGEHAKIQFLKMVEKMPVLMHIYKEEGGVFTVDLKRPPEIKGSSSVPLSLRDKLVFTGIASSLRSREERSSVYRPPSLPKVSTEVTVVVCHVNSPGDFYIQTVDRLGFLVFLRRIKRAYDNENRENLEFLCPVKGQACIAKSAAGTWYRAEVTGLPAHQELEVIDVDTGRTARVALQDIRPVKDEFLSSPKKAIKCKLALIEPANRLMLWSREAKEKFEEMASNEFLICSVTRILEDDVLLVELFHFPRVPEMKAFSINNRLVKEGVACYTPGCTVKADSTENVDVWDPPLEEVLAIKTDVAGSEVQDASKSSYVTKLVSVHICNVVTPEKIYFRWLEAETVFQRLQEEMAAAYENSKPEQVPWNNNMKCAVWIPELKQWRRGQITNVISEVLVEVVQYDFGIKVEVNVAYLRKLKGYLMKLEEFAFECSLVDISFYKVDRSDSASETSLKISLKPKSPEVTTGPKKCCQLEKKGPDSVTKHKEFKPVAEPETFEIFKPPIIPSEKAFDAVVSWVADDGTIYVIPKLRECEFTTLMQKLQGFFSGFGHLSPYPWKKGEASVVKGSDSLWYRSIILEILNNRVKVQYVDLGYVQLILPCYLYPVECYLEVPRFCIPCQLHNTFPVGNVWQPDAVELLRDLLLPRKEVKIHMMKSPEHPGGKLSVHLYLGGISLSFVMAQHKYCTSESWEDLVKLKQRSCHCGELRERQRGISSRFLPQYSVLSLPPPGNLFPIQVRHLILPNEVYIRLGQEAGSSPLSDTDESAIVWKAESLDRVLQHWKDSVTSLLLLTGMKTGMPCLAQTHDDLWSREIIISINKLDPLSVLVQFVDSGTYQKLPPSRLRQIPDDLMRDPAQAVKVTLAGFRPPKKDLEKIRIPYYPNWSLEAIWAMIECLRDKRLHALTLVNLYGLIHVVAHPLILMS